MRILLPIAYHLEGCYCEVRNWRRVRSLFGRMKICWHLFETLNQWRKNDVNEWMMFLLTSFLSHVNKNIIHSFTSFFRHWFKVSNKCQHIFILPKRAATCSAAAPASWVKAAPFAYDLARGQINYCDVYHVLCTATSMVQHHSIWLSWFSHCRT